MDAQLARAWHKATGQRVAMMRVYRYEDDGSEGGALPPEDKRADWSYGEPEWCRYDPDAERVPGFDRDARWSTVPDVESRPWEWLMALVAKGEVVAIDEAQVQIRPVEVDIAEDDAVEAALETAIREWEVRA